MEAKIYIEFKNDQLLKFYVLLVGGCAVHGKKAFQLFVAWPVDEPAHCFAMGRTGF